MAKSRKSERQDQHQQPAHQRERERAADRSQERKDYVAGADGELDVEPGREESGGAAADQDIDTAGMIPDNKATKNDEPGG